MRSATPKLELELELIQTQMTQKPMLRVEVGARALRNQTGGGGGGRERVQRSVGALAQVCVSGPQNRKRSQEGINPPSELSRSLFRHNHGAAGGGHPIIELPCILYQTPRTLFANVSLTALRAGPPLLGWYTSGGPPRGRSLLKDRDVRTYAKKNPFDFHFRPNGFMVSVHVLCVFLCPPLCVFR